MPSSFRIFEADFRSVSPHDASQLLRKDTGTRSTGLQSIAFNTRVFLSIFSSTSDDTHIYLVSLSAKKSPAKPFHSVLQDFFNLSQIYSAT